MKALTTLLVVGMFATTIAMADDSDDVKAAVEELFAAIRAGDANGQSRPRMPDYSNFGRGGGLLLLGRRLGGGLLRACGHVGLLVEVCW